MCENKDREMDRPSSKALLYSEILDNPVTARIEEILQKRKKGSTFHVGRSPVLAKVSGFLQSIDKSDEEVKNIEVVEEGEPVIEMSVTLIGGEGGNEYDSDNDTENETEGKKLIVCSDSESEMSENESKENALEDENMLLFSNSDSELSENESEEDVFKNVYLDREQLKNEAENTAIEDKALLSSDSEDDTPKSEPNVLKDTKLFTSSDSVSEQFGNISKKVVLKCATFQESDDESAGEESVEGGKYLTHSNLGLKASNSSDLSCKYQSDLPKLSFTGEQKRKLISVIEEVDEQSVCPSTKQKTV